MDSPWTGGAAADITLRRLVFDTPLSRVLLRPLGPGGVFLQHETSPPTATREATPAGRACVSAEDLTVAAISTSPFFAVLPPEVRIEVLVIAFCGLRL
ncbi:hypothetical protein HYQ46_001754 [Verticillium longisporum]|nr:hypothetical protein HYQ46_001754 [Verticillium longisporum]